MKPGPFLHNIFCIALLIVLGLAVEIHGADEQPQITAAPGFKVNLIYSVPPEQGSWVCMAVDPQGRLLVSPQVTNRPSITAAPPVLFRLTLENQKVARVEPIHKNIDEPQGLLYAFDSLYVDGTGPEGCGIYRLRQRGKDDFDTPQLIHLLNYVGEHGSHGLVLGPDQKIYLTSGNYVGVASNEVSSASPFRNFGEEQLLPRYRDSRGMGEGPRDCPGGTVLRFNADGSDCEIFCARTRNIYDIAFNSDGELFGYDNDHEWDWGTPWYRPDRLYHLVSGGDFGFREGTAKMPDYYDDVLPAVKNVSIGAPTGLKFGTGTKFPEKYRTALFMLEWSYGRIFAAHLHPNGSTYTADVETIVRGKPLNVTDIEVTPDGSMYFITGGRKTRSALYQLQYTNTTAVETVVQNPQAEQAGAKLRNIRHGLEALQGKEIDSAVTLAWPYLGNADRNIRYAARIAIESQPIAQWESRALNETNPATALTALLALTRVGGKEVQPSLLSSAAKFPIASIPHNLSLLKLRVLESSFIHQGRPEPSLASAIVAELNPRFPSESEPMTRELCQLLLYLDAPAAITKSLDLAHHAATRESQVYYLYRLSSISNGWTISQRKDYFKMLKDSSRPPLDPALVALMEDAGLKSSDDIAFDKFLKLFRDAAAKTLPDPLRFDLDNDIYGVDARGPVNFRTRKFVRRWKVQDFAKSIGSVGVNRDFQSGEGTFVAANCIVCHRFNGKGTGIGPDLSAISQRATARDILESILQPSNVIADAYRNTIFYLKTGDGYIGKVLEQTGDKIVVETDPTVEKSVTIKESDIDSRTTSKVSPMPEGLADQFTESQILDLIAYLQAGGNSNTPAFNQSARHETTLAH